MKITPTSIAKVNVFVYMNKKMFSIFFKWVIRKTGDILCKFHVGKKISNQQKFIN